MAETKIPIQALNANGNGQTTAPVAATSEMYFQNDGHVVLVCHETASDTPTVTVTCVNDPYARNSPAPTWTAAPGAVGLLGTFSTEAFNDAAGYVHLTISATLTNLTLFAVRG